MKATRTRDIKTSTTISTMIKETQLLVTSLRMRKTETGTFALRVWYTFAHCL